MFSDKEMGALTLMHYIDSCVMELVDTTVVEGLISHTYECFYMNHEDGTLDPIDTVTVEVDSNCNTAKIFCGTKDEVVFKREEMFELYGFFNGICVGHQVLSVEDKDENYFSDVPWWELPF